MNNRSYIEFTSYSEYQNILNHLTVEFGDRYQREIKHPIEDKWLLVVKDKFEDKILKCISTDLWDSRMPHSDDVNQDFFQYNIKLTEKEVDYAINHQFKILIKNTKTEVEVINDKITSAMNGETYGTILYNNALKKWGLIIRTNTYVVETIWALGAEEYDALQPLTDPNWTISN